MRYLVLGSSGMLGSAIVRQLQAYDSHEIIEHDTRKADLINSKETIDFLERHDPDAVFHCAGLVGGIQANKDRQYDFLLENTQMAINAVHAAWNVSIPRFYYMGSSCMYPRDIAEDLKESHLLTGALEPSNEGYALAKLVGMKLVLDRNKSLNLDYRTFIPCNLYGPGDNFDQSGHVLAALVKRFCDAVALNSSYVDIWGSGLPVREFMHVDDAARAIVFSAEKYNMPPIQNIGNGIRVPICELAQTISDVVGFTGKIYYDKSKPDGFPSKVMDVTTLKEIGFKERYTLRTGIKSMIEEYRNGSKTK